MNSTPRHDDARDATLLEIARRELGRDTLETRRSDSLDFSDQAVWSLKAALEAAYEAGRRSARSRKPKA